MATLLDQVVRANKKRKLKESTVYEDWNVAVYLGPEAGSMDSPTPRLIWTAFATSTTPQAQIPKQLPAHVLRTCFDGTWVLRFQAQSRGSMTRFLREAFPGITIGKK